MPIRCMVAALATLACVACATPADDTVEMATPAIIWEAPEATATPLGGVTATPPHWLMVPMETEDPATHATVAARTGNDRPPDIRILNADGRFVNMHCDDWWDPGPVDVTMEPGDVLALGPSVHVSRLWDGRFEDVDASVPLTIVFEPPAPVSATLSLVLIHSEPDSLYQDGLMPPTEVRLLHAPGETVWWPVATLALREYSLGVQALWQNKRFEVSCTLPVRLVP